MSLAALFLLSIAALCLASFTFGLTLVQGEVEALKEIAKTLQKNDWNFSVDPCSGQSNWVSPDTNDNSVKCNCSFANDKCHVTSIVLRRQNLAGMLPPELANLSYLQEFDVSYNYLNGTIPSEWGSLNLLNITLLANQLTGPIPSEIGNITTLQSLDLECNLFYGNLPQDLGNLHQIQRLFLTSNNFTGELPATFASLTSLQDFRIGGNQFSGMIPSFIQNWTNLEKLVIEGSGFSGPIPTKISFSTTLIELRISDLNGSDSTFPQLESLTILETLVLRSCNINGTLPEYLGTITSIKQLDLSFNKLSGPIPSTYASLSQANFIYLTGNFLNGSLPQWIHESGDIDVSYNNFSLGSREQPTCGTSTVNWFEGSLTDNNSGIVPCLRSFRCPKTSYFLYINSGGKQLNINGKIYEDDDDAEGAGAATFYMSRTNWAFSSTGSFLDSDRVNYYTWLAAYNLSMPDAELYTTARVSPLSLSYYAFCLGNGNYVVKLHFVEIIFTDDNTYSSLGRRVFDVYIQGKLVLKDFNIAEEAGGAGKAIIKEFIFAVTDGTLEIRFYWAGKGTVAVPFRAVYGPLISAVSVEPNFTPPSTRISAGAVVGIVFAVAVIIMLVVGVLWWRGYIGQKWSLARELKGLNMQTGLFTLRQIKAATNNFDASNKIGEGGFGPVYKGSLSDGTIIAVKQLSSKSRQGNREFINELGMISALQHPCLVKLYGCCVERDQLLLIYEYMENNSLARALFGPEEFQLQLDWSTRHNICVGIAKGLAFLHEESRLKVVHRDIKATNILLDKDLNPKISDFGLAKLDEEENTHISTRIAGTYGYMAPEYALHGYLSDKADVYSFGIVALEIVSGKTNTLNQPKQEGFHLLDWAQFLNEKGDIMELVDWRLGSKFNKEEVMMVIKVALLCTNVTPSFRPTMSSVVSMLEGKSVVEELDSDASDALDEMKLKAMRKYYQRIEEDKTREIHNPSTSRDGTWNDDSTTSTTDLYPLHLDSSYLDKRNY